MVATLEAISDATGGKGLEALGIDPYDIGLSFGASAAGQLTGEKYYRDKCNKGKGRLSEILNYIASTTTDVLANEFGCFGPRTTIVTACSSSNSAIGFGAEWIRDGHATSAIVGGADCLCELTFGGFNSLRSVDPDRCRPFCKTRVGLSVGEGAGILFLEEYEHARARGVKIYAEFLGVGYSADAFHMTAPSDEGFGAALAMKRALDDAGLGPSDIDYINAHGTATPHNDASESKAVINVFGELAYKIPVSSTKSMVGHCLGAAGAVEGVTTVLAIKNNFIPPTINYQEPDPDCPLDYVPNKGREARIRAAVSNSYAFGGNNTSVVFGSIE
jgi:3-oxoacyl-[acyl-carrier-protein] synthase II